MTTKTTLRVFPGVIDQGRHPEISLRRMPLSEEDREWRIKDKSGLYTTQRGQRLAIPSDSLAKPQMFNGVKLWQVKDGKTIRPGVRWNQHQTLWQGKALAWARDHVPVIGGEIPYLYYRAFLGHDLHISMFANLYAKHWHYGWTDPFNPEEPTYALDKKKVQGWGFLEHLGWLSGAKVTDVFVSETIDELVSSAATEFADFDSQEVGTSTQVENNNDTALIATTSIARVGGAPTDSDPDYQSVGTITADATETWEEWGIFNNTAGASLMDRSLTGGQAVNSSDQVAYTYVLTLNPEA